MIILPKGTYYGEKKLELENKGLILSEYNYHLPQTDWHYHENPYFMYVLDGNVYDVNKKGKTTCSAGSLLLHNWNEQHFNSKASPLARGFHIEFERKWFDDKKLNIDLWEGSRRMEDPRLHHILGKLYAEFKCQDEFSETSIDLLLLQLCERTQSNAEGISKFEPDWIPELKQIIHDQTDSLSLADLSKTLGVHPVHLSRAIPKYLNTTLGDYIRQQRIKKALGFMMNEQFTLTEITYLCGFSDQSHFTRTFKMYYHTTPKAFRKQLLSC